MHRGFECPAASSSLRGISKFFPGVIANENIRFECRRRGKSTLICGENGAGKSTLMKILYGMQPPDEGSILIEGDEVRLHSPRDAIDYGIGMVHQHFMLADNFSVLENVILGAEPSTGGYLHQSSAEKQVQELCDSYGLNVSIHTHVEELAVGQRQRVEIIKVLFRGVDILILDEPTSVLVPQEVEDLFVDDARDERARQDFDLHRSQAGRSLGDSRPYHCASGRPFSSDHSWTMSRCLGSRFGRTDDWQLSCQCRKPTKTPLLMRCFLKVDEGEL